MGLRIKVASNKEELLNFKNQILKLFQASFGKILDERVWQWAYINNPLGEPIVSLCFNENDTLVGHYAVIPLLLKTQNGSVNTGLSMTTMIDVRYRKYGIFTEQAKQVYDKAVLLGFQLLIGFPNKQSAPAFKKLLGWQLHPVDYVCNLTKEQLIKSNKFKIYLNETSLARLNIYNHKFRHWRLSKPQTRYYDKGTIILKDFGPSRDIVFIDKGFEDNLEAERNYNILIDSQIDDFREYQVSEYQFGYKILDKKFKVINFKKDLLMSDVF